MRASLREKFVQVCDEKIISKGQHAGFSFYALFGSRNTDPELLMEAATWWIETHRLDHFEAATKVKKLITSGE